MIFEETEIPGVMLVLPEVLEDSRGFFARAFCAQEFQMCGLAPCNEQTSLSFNKSRGTLRGMHIQAPPYEEAKLVRVMRGSIFDVAVDLRKNSPLFKRWTARVLNSENRHALYVPAGCAHGFLTLDDQTEVLYQISPAFERGFSRGFSWDDDEVAIEWPFEPLVMSEQDRALPMLRDWR
jgi:dTDP-4-dehydrorhamnose 3,5-epimerase